MPGNGACPSQLTLKIQIKYKRAELFWMCFLACFVQGHLVVLSGAESISLESCFHLSLGAPEPSSYADQAQGRVFLHSAEKWLRALISFPRPYIWKLRAMNDTATWKVIEQFWLRAKTCVFPNETAKRSWLSDTLFCSDAEVFLHDHMWCSEWLDSYQRRRNIP